jgi:hypothetical protein
MRTGQERKGCLDISQPYYDIRERTKREQEHLIMPLRVIYILVIARLGSAQLPSLWPCFIRGPVHGLTIQYCTQITTDTCTLSPGQGTRDKKSVDYTDPADKTPACNTVMIPQT